MRNIVIYCTKEQTIEAAKLGIYLERGNPSVTDIESVISEDCVRVPREDCTNKCDVYVIPSVGFMMDSIEKKGVSFDTSYKKMKSFLLTERSDAEDVLDNVDYENRKKSIRRAIDDALSFLKSNAR